MKDLKKKFRISFNKNWPVLALALLVLSFFWRVWLQNLVPIPGDLIVGSYFPWLDYKWGYEVGVPVKNPIVSDAISFVYPMRMLAIDTLKQGKMPFWNPYLLAGTPLLANFQSAVFSPTNIVYFVFDKLTAWSIQIMLQHFLAGVFVYLLLRRWKVSKLGSTIGGFVYAFSGYCLIWSQWNSHTLAASMIPLFLFFEDKWFDEKKIRDLLGVALTIVVSLFSGYPQSVFYAFIAGGLLYLFKLVKNFEEFKSFKKRKIQIIKLTLFGLFVVLGIGLAMPQVLPGAELLSLSQREVEPIPDEWVYLPFSKIITFIAPDYFGNHATGNYWGPQNYTSNTGYVGIVASALAIIGLWNCKKRREIWFCFAVILVSLFLSFRTLVSEPIWEWGILGLKAATAHRALVLFVLGISLITGFGVDRLKKEKVTAWPVILLLGSLLTGFGWYAWKERNLVALRNLVLPVMLFAGVVLILMLIRRKQKLRDLSVYLLFLLLVFELFRFGWKFTPFVPRKLVYPNTPVIDFLMSQKEPSRIITQGVMPVNQNMPYGIESLGGYDAVYPLVMAKYLGVLNNNSPKAKPQDRYGIVDNMDSPLLDLANTKYLLAKKDFDYDSDKYDQVFEDGSVIVLGNKKALPRRLVIQDWEVVEDEIEMFKKLLDPEFPSEGKILLDKDPGEVNRMLFVSETFYPGWKAYVAGKEVPIYRANYSFRAVPLLQETEEVEFVYAPETFRMGLALSAISAILALSVFGVLKKSGYTW